MALGTAVPPIRPGCVSETVEIDDIVSDIWIPINEMVRQTKAARSLCGPNYVLGGRHPSLAILTELCCKLPIHDLTVASLVARRRPGKIHDRRLHCNTG